MYTNYVDKPFFLQTGCGVMRSKKSTVPGLAILLLFGLILLAPHADANPALPTDLSYSNETTWILPALPDLSATSGYIPHNFSHGEAIFQVGNETIHGFRPGKVYPEMYIRDIAWGMETAQYYYPNEYLRDPIEAYLRRQYGPGTVSLDGDFGVVAGTGAIGGILTPQGRSNKQTITTDEETSLIHAAYLYYSLSYNTDWLKSKVNNRTVIERLNLAAGWLLQNRLDAGLQLLWRGHTTDWGDVKFEDGPGYTDFNPAQDHKTASIYDQALAYMALLELAEMNAAVGDTSRADQWQNVAEALKAETNARLWQPDKGIYLTHAHISPLEHHFDENAMVSIANALAVYAGLTNTRQTEAIFKNLEQARLDAGVSKPGLSLYPFYPNQWPNLFFEYPGMGYGNYQNGGVWDWWGGVQIKAEFATGHADIARKHLFQVANDWQKHPGNIIEWQSSTDPRHEGSHYYSAAAGTMGSAIIEGFFGVELAGNGLTLQPRLGLNDGYIRVYQAATDRYAAYTYDWDQTTTVLNYGTNATAPVHLRVLKLRSEQVSGIKINGRPVDYRTETVGNDTYLVFSAPSGQHRIEIKKGLPLAAADAPPAIDAGQEIPNLATPSIARNAPPPPNAPQPHVDTAIEQAYTAGNLRQTPITVRVAREWRLEMLQMASVILVAATSVGLITLTVLRRKSGLSYTQSLSKK
jgi:hypothetical protein